MSNAIAVPLLDQPVANLLVVGLVDLLLQVVVIPIAGQYCLYMPFRRL